MAFNLSANDAIADEIEKRAMMRELAGNFNMEIDPTKFKQNQKLQKIRNLMEGTTSPGEAGNARKKLGPELFPRVETMGGMELAQGLPSMNGMPVQGPTQGPATPVYYDKMMNMFAPKGGPGGLQPTPMRMI